MPHSMRKVAPPVAVKVMSLGAGHVTAVGILDAVAKELVILIVVVLV